MWHDNAPSAYLVLALGNWLGGVTKVIKLLPLPAPQREFGVIALKHISFYACHIKLDSVVRPLC
jgi:hypothetical protein